MRRVTCFVIATLWIITPVFSQEDRSIADETWLYTTYSPGAVTIEEEISQFIETGFLPVGMEIDSTGAVSILLVRSPSTEIEGWVIKDYENADALQTDLTNGIQTGLVPMDISQFADRFAVLWVESPIPITGWRIHAEPNSPRNRAATINEFAEQGLTLWGLSISDETAWYLFVRIPELPINAVETYDASLPAIRVGINNAVRSGWVPNGLALFDGQVYIGYSR